MKYLALFFCVFMLISLVEFLNAKPDKPNVLLIYTDDHRYSGVHILGKQQVKTPNIDQLAEDGVAFTNAYLMGSFSGATCIPSRAMLHTGRHLFALDKIGYNLPAEHKTIGETFKNAGYYSQIIGKWHQDHGSLYRSFNSGEKLMGLGPYLVDHFRMPFWDWPSDGKFRPEDAYLLQYNEEGNVIRRALNNEDKKGPIGTEKNGPHTSEVFADQAVSFFNSYTNKSPFFLYLAFHAPHDPRQAPQKYRDMYPPENIELPPSYMSQHPFDNGHLVLRDEELAPWPRTPGIAKQQLTDYYAIITHLDEQIGKVIRALKESGLYKNTLIVLAGDSGLGVGCHGLLGKQNIYDEDGIHVPLIFSGGLIDNHGTQREGLCYIHDIFPTICDITETPKPKTVSGRSLLPMLKNEKTQIYEYTYHVYRQYQRAYRKGNYKLIEYVKAKDFEKDEGEVEKGSRVTQLFNIKEDPWETFNLAYFPEYKELLGNMRNGMKEAAIEFSDSKESVETRYDFWDFY